MCAPPVGVQVLQVQMQVEANFLGGNAMLQACSEYVSNRKCCFKGKSGSEKFGVSQVWTLIMYVDMMAKVRLKASLSRLKYLFIIQTIQLRAGYYRLSSLFIIVPSHVAQRPGVDVYDQSIITGRATGCLQPMTIHNVNKTWGHTVC